MLMQSSHDHHLGATCSGRTPSWLEKDARTPTMLRFPNVEADKGPEHGGFGTCFRFPGAADKPSDPFENPGRNHGRAIPMEHSSAFCAFGVLSQTFGSEFSHDRRFPCPARCTRGSGRGIAEQEGECRTRFSRWVHCGFPFQGFSDCFRGLFRFKHH